MPLPPLKSIAPIHRFCHFAGLVVAICSSAMLAGDIPAFSGKTSDWHDFVRHDFEVDGKPVVVVAPKQPAPGRPWAGTASSSAISPPRTVA